jgi:hypothetical protein
MTRPPFPEVLDSSLIAAFRSCPQKGRLEYFDHWKPKSPSVHLHAGAAYAKALEVARTAYYLGDYHIPEATTSQDKIIWRVERRDPLDARMAIECGFRAMLVSYGDFACPPDSAKSLERMCGAYEYYFTQYPLESDKAVPVTLPSGKRGIEFSFAEPIDAIHPETGNPLLYVGRMDMICEYAGGWFGEDDKTTSQLGASWSKQWDLRSQFTGYCWGAERAGFPLQGFLVRGVSILKTKYETQQAITYRPKWMIERWYDQLLRDVARMRMMWLSGVWDYDLDHACSEYGGCPFRQVCLSAPDQQPIWLRQGFERRRWDPVTREETLLEDPT